MPSYVIPLTLIPSRIPRMLQRKLLVATACVALHFPSGKDLHVRPIRIQTRVSHRCTDTISRSLTVTFLIEKEKASINMSQQLHIDILVSVYLARGNRNWKRIMLALGHARPDCRSWLKHDARFILEFFFVSLAHVNRRFHGWILRPKRDCRDMRVYR